MKEGSEADDEEYIDANDLGEIDVTGDYAEQTIDLIFSLNAQYKNPLVIKPKSWFLGFQDNKFYAVREEKVKIE